MSHSFQDREGREEVGGEVRGEGGEEGEGGKDRKALHTRMLYMSSVIRCTLAMKLLSRC